MSDPVFPKPAAEVVATLADIFRHQGRWRWLNFSKMLTLDWIISIMTIGTPTHTFGRSVWKCRFRFLPRLNRAFHKSRRRSPTGSNILATWIQVVFLKKQQLFCQSLRVQRWLRRENWWWSVWITSRFFSSTGCKLSSCRAS